MYTNVLTLALSPPEVIDLTAVTSVFMIKNREESFFLLERHWSKIFARIELLPNYLKVEKNF